MKRKVRLLLAVCIALLCTGVSWARKTLVWDSPAIAYGTNNGDGFFNLSLDVT